MSFSGLLIVQCTMINGLYIAVLVLRWKVGSRTAVLHEVGCSCPSLFDYPTVQRPHDGRARKQQQPTAENHRSHNGVFLELIFKITTYST
jgi:hypothetical protein